MSFNHVVRGDSVRFRAETWNCMLDAASAEKKRQAVRDRHVVESFNLANTIRIKNTTGGDLDTGDAIELGVPDILPSENQVQFEIHKTLTGVTPTGNVQGGAILAEPIPDGQYGLAYMSGVAAANVNVTHASIDRCDLGTSTTLLQTKLEGPHKILWRESGTGTQPAYIQIGQPRNVKVLGKANGNITAGSTNASVHVWASGSDTGYDLAGVHFTWFDASTISSGKELIVTWFPDEMRWRITHAECE